MVYTMVLEAIAERIESSSLSLGTNVESVSKRLGILTVKEIIASQDSVHYLERIYDTHHRLKCLRIWWQEFKAAN